MNNDFTKIFTAPGPGDELKAWLDSGYPAPVFLNLAQSIPAGPVPYHKGSVLEHLARCMNEVAGDPAAVWMALAHDAGKLTTPREMWPHHYAHELRGEKLASIWAKQLGLSESMANAGVITSRIHMKAGKFFSMKPGKRLKFLEDVDKMPYPESFWKVVNADSRSEIGNTLAQYMAIIKDAEKSGLNREKRIMLIKGL